MQSPLIGGPLGRIILRKVVACACAVGVKYIAEQWLSRLTVEKFRAMHLRPLQRHLSAVAVHQASTVRPLAKQTAELPVEDSQLFCRKCLAWGGMSETHILLTFDLISCCA